MFLSECYTYIQCHQPVYKTFLLCSRNILNTTMARTFIEKEKQPAEHGENYIIINREDTGIQGLSPEKTQTDTSITSGVGKD